ncbi:MAG TPA: hypothetical protein VJC16_00085 [Candidatus Nanoarchaeia archaeon]|nr:hypothetical protein [Candidatus Nanoarchaeia archaeon]
MVISNKEVERMHNVCGRCHGASTIVLGALVLVKEYWLPSMTWWTFIGIILVLMGLMKAVKPCGCGHPMMDMPKKRR